MGALSDERVAGFIGDNFVAAFHQVGDFEVVNVNGKIQKNGGNVVSFFCTPKGDVIHAVVGPVSAGKLLKEANWAVGAHETAVKFAGTNQVRQTQAIEQAHLAALGTSPEQFHQAVKQSYPQAYGQAQGQLASLRQEQWRGGRSNRYARNAAYRKQSMISSPVLQARREAAGKYGSDRVHQIMAAQPLAKLKDVYRELFEDLANEEVAEPRGRIYQAGRGFKKARDKGLPVMLVLYDAEGEYSGYDEATKGMLRQMMGSRQVRSKLRKFVTVAVPLDELSALSQVAEIPIYSIQDKTTPVVIFARSSGQQHGSSLSGYASPMQLASRMDSLLTETRFDQAKTFASQGKFSSAERVLRRAIGSTRDTGIRERARHRLAQLNIQWAQSLAKKGSTDDALRRLKRVQLMSDDSNLQDLAAQRIAQLASNRG